MTEQKNDKYYIFLLNDATYEYEFYGEYPDIEAVTIAEKKIKPVYGRLCAANKNEALIASRDFHKPRRSVA